LNQKSSELGDGKTSREEGDGTRPECTPDDGDGVSDVFAELGAGDFPDMRELGDGDLPALTVEEGLGPYNGGGGLDGLGDVHPGTRNDGDGDPTMCIGDGDGNVAGSAGSTTMQPRSPEFTKQYALIALAHAVERSQPVHVHAAWVHGESS
jgi:hypothetical protein